MHSERRVLLSGGGVSGGADGLPVSSGTNNLVLRRRERKQTRALLIACITTPTQFPFPVGGKKRRRLHLKSINMS